jgi:hypothetical protein
VPPESRPASTPDRPGRAPSPQPSLDPAYAARLATAAAAPSRPAAEPATWAAPAWPPAGEPATAGAPSWPPAAEPATAGAPSWPPAGELPPLPELPVRTPAGSYLAPSAVLPPLDAPSARNGHAENGGHAHVDARKREPGATPRLSLAETLEAFGITADTPRQVVGVGAAIAALGFLLPWADVLAGSGLIGDYWSRWGLAGPAAWIVVAALLCLVTVALAGGQLRRVPVGAAGITIAALLVGLVWPYLFGYLGRSVGVWIVLAGSLVLAIGGAFDARGRHESERPSV